MNGSPGEPVLGSNACTLEGRGDNAQAYIEPGCGSACCWAAACAAIFSAESGVPAAVLQPQQQHRRQAWRRPHSAGCSGAPFCIAERPTQKLRKESKTARNALQSPPEALPAVFSGPRSPRRLQLLLDQGSASGSAGCPCAAYLATAAGGRDVKGASERASRNAVRREGLLLR